MWVICWPASLIGCCSTKSTRYVLFTEDINRGAVYVPKLINLLNLRFTRKNNLLKYIWNMLIVHAWIICMWQPSRELLLLRLMIYKTYWNFTEACISGSLVNIWLNRIARTDYSSNINWIDKTTEQNNWNRHTCNTYRIRKRRVVHLYKLLWKKYKSPPDRLQKLISFCISCYMNESCTSSSLSYIWNDSFKMRSPQLVLRKVERNGMKCFVIIIVWIFQFSIAYKIAIKCNFLAIATLKATNMWN